MRRACLLALGLAGCDPGWKIEGTVVDNGGAPVDGASVVLSCPGGGTGAGPVAQTKMTDASGHFAFGGVSGAANAGKCTLAITKAGFTTKNVDAPDACYRSTETKNFDVPCAATDGHITLLP